MKPLIAMYAQTWWLWTACFVTAGAMAFFLSTFFLVLLPMLSVVFIYFSYVRFDSNGNPRDL